jgi:hypothetical protein
MSARRQCDRYLISATASGCDFPAYLICPPDKTAADPDSIALMDLH